MPKVEIDYSNTIIYKITCKDSNVTDVYVGHTTNFIQRKHTHKQACINDKSSSYNCKLYKVIRNNGGWDNWNMEIVNFFNCNDHYEARKKEQEYFELLHATLNSIEPMPKPKSIPEKIIKQNIPKQIYYCDVCKIKFQNSKLMEIHNQSKKHIKKQQYNKNSKKHHCIICDFYTNKINDYNRHLLTPKHINNSNNTNNTNKMAETTNDFTHFTPYKLYNCECGKEYLHMSSLCKHKKSCDTTKQSENIIMNIEDEKSSAEFDAEMIIELLKQNQEFKELILEQNKQMMEQNKQILELSKDRNVTNNITQNNNNKFNLNVFLNETCKDALNLSEFLESLILTLTDFENFGPLGYCGGISNILVNGLNKLDISKRPIHCSDLKREVIHIKNNDTWHKDDDKEQMIKAIKAIEHKNVKQMSLWGKANPEYKDPNHKKSDLYTKLIDQSLCDTDKEKALKNYNKIIRSVAKEILVDKNQ
jgi:hypothetical protein